MADLQNTLQLVLTAKDEASDVLKHVGDMMARLGDDAVVLQEKLSREGVSISSADAVRAATTQRLAQEKEGYQQSLAAAKTAEKEMVQALAAADRERVAGERKQAAQRLAQSRLDRAAALLQLNQDMAREQAAIAKNSSVERENIVRQTAQRLADAKSSHEADLKMAEEWLEKRRTIGREADEAALSAARAAEVSPGVPRLNEEQIQAFIAKQQAAAEAVDQVWAREYERMVASATDTYTKITSEAESGGKQLLEASRAFEQAERAERQKWLIEGTESINDAYEQRNTRIREILRQAIEGSRVQYQQDVANYLSAEQKKTEVAQTQYEERMHLIKAAGEMRIATTAEDQIKQATEQATASLKTLGETVRALPAPKPLAITVDREAITELSADFQMLVPRLDLFQAALEKIARGAGTTAEKLLEMRTAEETAVRSLGQQYNMVLSYTRDVAQEQTQAIALQLKQQLADIGGAEQHKIELIQRAAREIQQVLRDAYSGPGITEALRSEGQKAIAAVRDMEQGLVRETKMGGDQQRAAAEQAAQTARARVKVILGTEVSDLKVALDEEVAAREEAGKRAALALREQAAASEHMRDVFGLNASAAHTVLGPLSELVNMGRQMLVWNTAYQVWGKMSDAIGQSVGGLISTNSQVEQLSQSFAALYHTSTQAGVAMIAGLNEFAAKVPATREEVHDAALQFAAAGDNVAKIMTPASDLASIMGQKLPDAAHAMVDAQMGRFEMLQMTLKTTKTELEGYGLQVDATGHVLNNSFVPAIERYAAARFGEHIAMDAKQARAAGESLYFSAQQVRQFQQHLAVPTGGVTAREIQAGAQIAGGALPIGTSDAERTATLTTTLTALTEMRSRDARTAKEGFETLHSLYGLQQGDLDRISKGWRDTGTAAQEAFGKWLAANYGGQQALLATQAQQSASQRQMKTLAGLFSNVQDAFENLQEVMGKGVFNVLHGQVQRLIDTMNSPALLSWAAKFGTGLGQGLKSALDWLSRVYHNLGGLPGILAIVNGAWQRTVPILRGVGDVLANVWGTLSLLWRGLSALYAPIGAIIGFFSNLITLGHGTDGTWHTLVATIGTLLVAYKGMVAGLSLVNDAMKLKKNVVELVNKALSTYNDMVKRAVEAQNTAKGSTDSLSRAKQGEKLATDAEREATDELALSEEKEKIAADNLSRSESVLTQTTDGTTTAQNNLHTAVDGSSEAEVVATTKTEGLTTAEGQLTTATDLARDAENNLKVATDAAKDSTVLMTEKTEAETAALGAEGLEGAAAGGAREMENLAIASGEAGAAGAMATAATSTGRLTGLMAVMKGAVTSTAAAFVLWAADIWLVIKAIQTASDDWQAWQNVTKVKDIDKTLLPQGKDTGAFGHYLDVRQGGMWGMAYRGYGELTRGSDPSAFIDYILSHPQAYQQYQRTMQKEGRWDAALKAIQQYQIMQGQGAIGLNVSDQQKQGAQDQQAYDKALQQFQADLRYHPEQALADLDTIQQTYQQWQEDHESVMNATRDAAALYRKLQAQIPAKYRTTQAYMPQTPPGGQGADTGDGTTGKTPKQYAKDLAAFVSTTWTKTLDQIRAGTIDSSDVEQAISQYENLQQEAGKPVTDTKIRDAVKEAYKKYVSGVLVRAFNADLKLFEQGRLQGGQAVLDGLANQIQSVEAAAGITDYTDWQGKVTDAVKKAAGPQIKNLTERFRQLFFDLQHHLYRVTVDQVQQVINQLQQVEVSAGVTDTTGMMQSRLEAYQQQQQTRATSASTRGSPAWNNLQDLSSSIKDYKSQLDALIKLHPEQRDRIMGLIDQIVDLTGQYDRAKKIPWPATLKHEDTVRRNLTLQYEAVVGPVQNLGQAHDRLALDLKNLGDSAKDYKRLMDDARTIQRLDLVAHHSKTHAEHAYATAVGQVNKHMTDAANSQFKDDLASLGRSSKDHARLIQDVNALYEDEKRQYPHTRRAHTDYVNNLNLITKHMKDTHTAMALPPGPSVSPYPSYAPRIQGTTYGQTVAWFGGTQRDPSAAIIAELRAQNAALRQQLEHDNQIIMLLETGNQNSGSMVGLLRGITIGPPHTTSTARSATSVLRGRGSMLPTAH